MVNIRFEAFPSSYSFGLLFFGYYFITFGFYAIFEHLCIVVLGSVIIYGIVALNTEVLATVL